ncbi:uncharacterized protein LOC131677532 isoform X2 [Topomyia yanbarensis]|nr:uncharacterized protein LOC131677532 isoform X2 [Topomyia yanbarensis]XP_058813381.1 uncharacterized protein LOC131677532 isoform X2 [Topomyia yanbarensis]
MAAPNVSSDWDIDAHRAYYEPTEHWNLRRNFMEKHRHWIPEDELVCLAQIFVNVELLRCRYPPATMERLAELSAGVADEYRASRRNCLRRTFVSASDAAISKVRNSIWQKVVAEDSTESSHQNSESQVVSPPVDVHQPQASVSVRTPTFKPIVPIRSIEDVYNNIVLLNDLDATQAAFNCLGCGQLEIIDGKNSAGQNFVKVQVGDYVLVDRTFGSEKPVKVHSKQIILNELKRHCFKLKRTKPISNLNKEVERHVTKAMDSSGRRVVRMRKAQSSSVNLKNSAKIGEDNVGFKLLRRLGWDGGPLGQNGTGIMDPIVSDSKGASFNREGLGMKTDRKKDVYNIDANFYRETLRNFRNSGVEYDLVFCKQFNIHERRLLSNIAKEEHLETNLVSHSKNNKNLVVLGRKLTPHELLERIIIDKDPVFCSLYRVEHPCADKTEGPKEIKKSHRQASWIKPPPVIPITSSYEKITEPPSDFEPRTRDFGPLPEIKSISDIYHSIVLIGYNFKHTQRFFGQLNCGQLELNITGGLNNMFEAQILLGKHIIATVSANTKQMAELGVKQHFMRQLGAWCYRIRNNNKCNKNSRSLKKCHKVHKQDNRNRPLRVKQYVVRVLGKAKTIDYSHYCDMIKKFHDTGSQYDLVFCPEFTNKELAKFETYSKKIGAKSCRLGKPKNATHHLIIFGRPILAIDILQRVLVQKDPVFSNAYTVQPPNNANTCDGVDSESD